MRLLQKSLAAAAVALLVLPTVAQAQRKYGMAGCGLGSVVMGAKGSQISAATTNGTGVQTFGISSGTSNCNPDSKAAVSEAQETYMFNNYASLSKETAQGSGATLAGLATVLGCGEAQQAEFNKFVQEEHRTIFSAPGAVAALETLKETLAKNEQLAQNCKHASNSNTKGAH
ncbi:MAG: DUF3015 domain-containing protein [Betaproteobacteria bacterium]|nr:DUF3015 domain-containing protein [Betaproteobacteria bacterium]